MGSGICIIGCGKMGQAMLAGWLYAENGLSAEDFCVVEHSSEKCASLSEAYGIDAFDSLVSAFDEAGPFRIYLLAVKPQVLPGVLEDLGRLLQSVDGSASPEGHCLPLVVSIAAGITTQKIREALPDGVRIVRVMPNTPLQVGAGATVVAAGPCATQDDIETICEMFSQLGIAESVSESDIDAVCALSGGGPAYTALMIEALTKAGAVQGLSPELAERLALQTIYGTCKLMEETGASPEQTRVAVCSPGGTTLAALAAMEGVSADGARSDDTSSPIGFTESIDSGIAAAVARAKELASC